MTSMKMKRWYYRWMWATNESYMRNRGYIKMAKCAQIWRFKLNLELAKFEK